MEVVNGRLTGQLATPNCRGAQKARLVRRDLDEHPVRTVWAYGNSGADRAMLDLADVAIRVRPYRPLRSVR
jgi:phosphoserine phosphatase